MPDLTRNRPLVVDDVLASEVGVSNGVLVQMEERVRRPPRDGVKGVNEVAGATLLVTVILAGGVHPVNHFVKGVARLMVAPVTVHQTTKAHGDGAEVVLERGVV